MKFFFRSSTVPFDKLELLSVHIPKTGGVSFLNILKNNYGSRLVKIYEATLLRNINEGSLRKLPNNARALHGHFELNRHTRKLFPNAKIICWLRKPVERVYSHYNYWKTYPPHGNPVHDRFLNNKPSLSEFINDPLYARTVNAYTSFLSEINLKELFFVGRLEEYKHDVRQLAHLMNWPSETLSFSIENSGSKNISPISPALYTELENLLADEILLYNKLLRTFY